MLWRAHKGLHGYHCNQCEELEDALDAKENQHYIENVPFCHAMILSLKHPTLALTGLWKTRFGAAFRGTVQGVVVHPFKDLSQL